MFGKLVVGTQTVLLKNHASVTNAHHNPTPVRERLDDPAAAALSAAVPPGGSEDAVAGTAAALSSTLSAAPPQTLDQFLARHTSEDNASFGVVLAKDQLARKRRNWWAEDVEGAVPAIKMVAGSSAMSAGASAGALMPPPPVAALEAPPPVELAASPGPKSEKSGSSNSLVSSQV